MDQPVMLRCSTTASCRKPSTRVSWAYLILHLYRTTTNQCRSTLLPMMPSPWRSGSWNLSRRRTCHIPSLQLPTVQGVTNCGKRVRDSRSSLSASTHHDAAVSRDSDVHCAVLHLLTESSETAQQKWACECRWPGGQQSQHHTRRMAKGQPSHGWGVGVAS